MSSEWRILPVTIDTIPGVEDAWKATLEGFRDMERRQDEGLIEADAGVELTLRVKVSRREGGIVVVSDGGRIKMPAFRARAMTAHERDGELYYVDAEQPTLPGIGRAVTVRSKSGEPAAKEV